MLYGLQTHFGSTIGDALCAEIAVRRVQLCRIDAQASSVDIMLEMVAEVLAAGMTPYVTVAEYGHIEALPPGAMCEWRNEPDIATNHQMPAADYAREFLQACEVAALSPVGEIGGPVVSNLNQRGTTYILNVIEACGGSLPSNAFGVTHRYGPPDPALSNGFRPALMGPHKLSRWAPSTPFTTRRDEYAWFEHTIGFGRKWIVSEGGWASVDDISEEEQAELARQEYALAEEEGAYAYVWYQLNDGSGSGNINHFGWRRIDGSWKPVADVIPRGDEDMAVSQTPLFVLDHAAVIHHADGTKSLRWNLTAGHTDASSTQVLSLQPDGRFETRSDSSIGVWEKAVVEGDRLVFRADSARAVFAWQA